jgi:hypothetical protein
MHGALSGFAFLATITGPALTTAGPALTTYRENNPKAK